MASMDPREIPLACLYGCPDPIIGMLAERLTAAAADAEKATAVGISAQGIEAIARAHLETKKQAAALANQIPEDPESACPWRPNTEGLPRNVSGVIGQIACCRIDGIVAIGAHETYRVRRAAPSDQTTA